jgi:hypothetical protein
MSIQHIEAYIKPVILSLLGVTYGKLSLVNVSVITTLILDITGIAANMEQVIHMIVLLSGAGTSVTGFGYIVFKFYRDYREFKNSKR